MLGRYQVEKELGKGAMGVVYLGKDPKIGRVVAIKTMALSQEFEADELVEVKERFFREAETAGRLAHQNIVTIYDAGEEHDLAYIAMELLKGGDLVPFTKPGALLPEAQVVSIIARTWRMPWATRTSSRWCIAISSLRTSCTTSKPTPSRSRTSASRVSRTVPRPRPEWCWAPRRIMSPEQLAGKKIDGRSDLFSLAVSLYQMLCGQLPFQGESMAQLMFKIANEPPIDILTVNPNVSPGLVAFIERAMAKDADIRYQTGEEFAAALRAAADGSAPAAETGGGVDIQL
jgi:serine/threonine protein kinase